LARFAYGFSACQAPLLSEVAVVFLKTFTQKTIEFGCGKKTDEVVNAWIAEHKPKIVDRKVHVMGVGGGDHSNGETYLVVEIWYEAEKPIADPDAK
jgi:hypothetical protein